MAKPLNFDQPVARDAVTVVECKTRSRVPFFFPPVPSQLRTVSKRTVREPRTPCLFAKQRFLLYFEFLADNFGEERGQGRKILAVVDMKDLTGVFHF